MHLGLLIGLAACALGGVYLFATRWGYEARVVGANPGFARHLGLQITVVAATVQALGGFIAAAGRGDRGAGDVSALHLAEPAGPGWNGLVVAILAGNNPLLVPPAALALSYLQVGGDLLSRNYAVPAEVVGHRAGAGDPVRHRDRDHPQPAPAPAAWRAPGRTEPARCGMT